MKRILCVLLLFFLFSNAWAQQRSLAALKGTWLAADTDNASAGIEVVDSTKMFLVYGDQKKQITSYKADFSKSPVWFDFTIKDGNQNMQLKSLIQFISEDLVQWQLFEGTTRPVHFANGAGDIMFLRRKK